MKYVLTLTIEADGLTEEHFAESKKELGIDLDTPIAMMSQFLQQKMQEHLDDLADSSIDADEVTVTVTKFNLTMVSE